MTISYDYEPIDAKNALNSRKEVMTIFLNFIFIVNYWKLKSEEKDFNSGIFNYDWTVSNSAFDQEEKIKIKDETAELFDNMGFKNSRLIEKG
jgi:hypothetical protein